MKEEKETDCRQFVMGKVDWLLNNGFKSRDYHVNKAIKLKQITMIQIEGKPKVIGIPPDEVDQSRYPEVLISYPELM